MVLTCKVYFLYLNCIVISYGNVNICIIYICLYTDAYVLSLLFSFSFLSLFLLVEACEMFLLYSGIWHCTCYLLTIKHIKNFRKEKNKEKILNPNVGV